MVDTGWMAKSTYYFSLCRYNAWCKAISESATLSCSQPLIGSLSEFSYLFSSWVVAGVVPGHSSIDASGAVIGDYSRWFMFFVVKVLRPRLAELLLVSAAKGQMVSLLSLLTTWSHPLIHRTSMRWQAAEGRLLHCYERIAGWHWRWRSLVRWNHCGRENFVYVEVQWRDWNEAA